jgi:hypothetical protein
MYRNERFRLTAYTFSGVHGWITERKSGNDINGDGDGDADCDSYANCNADWDNNPNGNADGDNNPNGNADGDNNADADRNPNGHSHSGHYCDLPGSVTVDGGAERDPNEQHDRRIQEHKY